MTGSSSTFEVHYFPIRGLAELPRLILEVSGLPYENSYPTEWLKEKNSTPFGQVPILIEKSKDGKEFKLAQSGAIVRYLAKKANIAGANEHEIATLESIYESLVDIRTHWLKAFYAPEANKQAAFDAFFKEQLPNWAKFNEKFFSNYNANRGNFIGGDKVTYVDLMTFILFEAWVEKQPNVATSYPTMKKIHDAVRQHPKVEAYLKSERRHKPTMQK